MPNIKSAKKRAKQNIELKARNKSYKSGVKTSIKTAKKDIKDDNKEQAIVSVQKAVKNIDKAVAKGLIHKNKAARDKSKLMKANNSLK